MDNVPATSTSDRLERFIERATGLRRNDVEAIVDRLIDRLDTVNNQADGRMAA